MILGLCGLKQSGKDTVAAYLVKNYGFERKAFADPLKRSVAALFDIPFHEVDKLKNSEHAFVEINGKRFSFRSILQRYGTEAHRDIFGGNFWVDITLPVQGFYPGRKIVVTDVRFTEEAERIRNLGGYNILIIREETAPIEQDPHRSEQIDFTHLIDNTIENDGTLEELYEQVEEILARTPVSTSI